MMQTPEPAANVIHDVRHRDVSATSTMRIAIIVNNIGPYHVARLCALARGVDILAVEIVARSAEYSWEPSKSVPFNRKTLFASDGSPEFTAAEFLRRLDRELSFFRPNVLAIPGWYGLDAFHALNWARLRNVPVVVMSDSQRDDFKRSAIKEWLKSRYLRLCQTGFVGGATHRAYLEHLGVDSECIWCGYDAVDNSFFNAGADAARANRGAMRSRYGLPERYFLASARFIPKKNLITLIKGYHYYSSKLGNDPSRCWNLVILGDGVLRGSLEAEVSKCGLTGRVQMPGFKQYHELPNYYGLARAFIMPSVTEQWGLVVNEAMASGLPVLVSNRCGCAPDLVKEGINGYVFDPLDPTNLGDFMLKVADDDCHRSAMGDASRAIIAEWSPERFAINLVRAASCAMSMPSRKASTFDAVLLRMLVARFK